MFFTPNTKHSLASITIKVYSCQATYVLFTEKKVVWNDILDLPDPVLVKYDVVEGLFSNYRQTMTDDERDDPGKQPSMVMTNWNKIFQTLFF